MPWNGHRSPWSCNSTRKRARCLLQETAERRFALRHWRGPAPAGPSEDSDDDNVALDDDESLPWPDRIRVQDWWKAHGSQMPADRRCFMGAPPSVEHCTQVLREGTQRQRFVAAQQRCLQAAGTPLFAVCAPAWRQQRLLA